MSAGFTPSSISAATHARLAEAALEFQPSVRLLRLPLLFMDGDCMDPVGMAGGPDEEPPTKRSKSKIIPYKLKESDKKMVYDSGTVIYTEEFKRSVWEYLLKHSLADGEARYPEISHSVLYKWRRKAHEQRGLFKPQRKSLMADLKKEREKDDNENSQSSNEKERRFSEPPKVPKLKISLKLTTKEDKDTKEFKEPKVKQITALSDDLTVEKKIKVVIFALQNSTQKAAEHFNLRAGDVHSFMSQNVIRRMALDRIRKKVTKGCRLGDSTSKSREEIEEIVNLARRTSVERAARQYGVREGQVIQWMRQGVPSCLAINQHQSNGNSAASSVSNGGSNEEDDENSEYLDFMLKVIDTARKQTLSRASKMFQVSPNQVLTWMRQYFTEDEVRRVKSSDEDYTLIEQKTDHKVDPRNFIRAPPIDADELEKTRRGEAGTSFESYKFPNGSSNGTLHTLSRLPFRNGRGSDSAPEKDFPATMGDELELMEDDVPDPLQRPSINGHADDRLNQADPNNNEASYSSSKETAVTLVNGVSKESKGGKGGSNTSVQEGKSLTLSLEEIEAARELGLTMRCLSRWLECRDHFAKLWSGRMAFAEGDALRELLSFRLEAVDYAKREGRLYAASVFRVTLSELHEWTGRKESYIRFLNNRNGADPRSLAVIDASSEFLFKGSEELARAQAIAHRVGIDLVRANRFIQQLYMSAETAATTSATAL